MLRGQDEKICRVIVRAEHPLILEAGKDNVHTVERAAFCLQRRSKFAVTKKNEGDSTLCLLRELCDGPEQQVWTFLGDQFPREQHRQLVDADAKLLTRSLTKLTARHFVRGERAGVDAIRGEHQPRFVTAGLLVVPLRSGADVEKARRPTVKRLQRGAACGAAERRAAFNVRGFSPK